MKFFRNKNQKSYAPVQTITAPEKRNPFFDVKSYVPLCENEMRLYAVLREAVPIIDAAINKIVRLVGGFKIASEDAELEEQLNKFLFNVKVNAASHGAEAFVATYLDQLLTSL